MISIGHNPGTNHPRMMGTLHELSAAACRLSFSIRCVSGRWSVLPTRRTVMEMATRRSTPIASDLLPGAGRRDAAALERDRQSAAAAGGGAGQCARPRVYYPAYPGILCLRRGSACHPLAGYRTGVRPDARIPDPVAVAYAKSRATIVTYGMGITQHNKGTSNVRLIADLLLMRGNIGKPGAGICSLRGHSNVQGNRTVGISENPLRPSSTACSG